MSSFVRESPSGIEIDLVVQPRASQSAFSGVHDERLKVRLAAPPVDGAANEALVRLVARTFAVPVSQVTLKRGDASRRKTLAVRGVNRSDALRALGVTEP